MMSEVFQVLAPERHYIIITYGDPEKKDSNFHSIFPQSNNENNNNKINICENNNEDEIFNENKQKNIKIQLLKI